MKILEFTDKNGKCFSSTVVDEKKNLIYNGDMRESDNFAQLDTMGNSMLSEKKIGRNES